jgi:hypothetical protein
MRPVAHIIVFVPLLLTFAGCTDMYNQPRYKPLRESKFYEDRLSARQFVEGTVARGDARTDELFSTGRIDGKLANTFPFPVTNDVVKRGQDKFNVFCSPCHGRLGDGAGMIVQRGFPKPNSFHADSVRARPVGYYFDVMTNGFGRMYSYASSVPVEDRWAIAAYIRALQLSRRVPLSELSAEEQNKIAR